MRSLTLTIFAAIFMSGVFDAHGQSLARRNPARENRTPQSPEIGKIGVIVDETLSVLRASPTLFAPPIQRMRIGRRVKITGVSDADGVRFFRVIAPPSGIGWVQSEAVFGTFRPNDDARMTRLINAKTGLISSESRLFFRRFFQNRRLSQKSC